MVGPSRSMACRGRRDESSREDIWLKQSSRRVFAVVKGWFDRDTIISRVVKAVLKPCFIPEDDQEK